MREDALHITLAFLGEVAENRLPELHEIAAAVELPKAQVQLDRVGFWNHNHVLWAGSKEPAPVLEKLAADLQKTLVEAGFLGEVKPFVPHVTLLRKLLHPGTCRKSRRMNGQPRNSCWPAPGLPTVAPPMRWLLAGP